MPCVVPQNLSIDALQGIHEGCSNCHGRHDLESNDIALDLRPKHHQRAHVGLDLVQRRLQAGRRGTSQQETPGRTMQAELSSGARCATHESAQRTN